MPRKPERIEVVEADQGRVVVSTFADGTVTRVPVETGGKRRRKPRKPIARAITGKRSGASPEG